MPTSLIQLPFAGILGPIGWPEILLILFVVMLLFGAKRLPELARGFGKSIKEFKKATTELEEEINQEDDAKEPETSQNGAAKPAAKAEKTESK